LQDDCLVWRTGTGNEGKRATGSEDDVPISSARLPESEDILKRVRATLICSIDQTGRSTAHALGPLSVQGTRSSGSARKA
jgi:hypothetical protein